MDSRLLDVLSAVTDEEKEILESQTINKSIYTDHGGFTIDKEKMLEQGRLISVRPHTRFIDFPAHCHNYIEIMYMCKGKTIHNINNAHRIVLEKGELLFINPHTFHAIRKAGKSDVAVNFIVLPQFFDAAYTSLDKNNILSRFISDGLRSASGDMSYLHFKASDMLPIQNLVENLIWNLITKAPNCREINRATMGLLFMQLINATGRLELPKTHDYDNKLVISVLHEIEENYAYASLTGLAKSNNMSVAGLSRLIKQQTGKTFKEILIEKRFSKALDLLQGTRLSVADISAYVGYENTSYFHRKFFELYKISPAQYRGKHA